MPLANFSRSAKLAIVILPCGVVFLILALVVVKFIRRLKRGDLESSFEHIHIIDSIEEEHFKQEADEENQEILAN